jgi:HAD superfamily hydrolase (TIGR01549 family)
VNRKRFSARVILFDWDGTLLNSYAADLRAYFEMFRAMEIEWDASKFEEHYSPDWYRVYRAVRLPRARWAEADRLWRLAYGREAPALLPEARRIVRLLSRDFRLGIVTSGSRSRVRKQLRSFKLAEYFSVCVCAEDAPRRKPHPAPLEFALRHLRATAEETVYIGDAPEDIEMARRAGVRPIGVLGPFPTAKRIRAAQPDLLLKPIGDLPLYLRATEKKATGRNHTQGERLLANTHSTCRFA